MKQVLLMIAVAAVLVACGSRLPCDNPLISGPNGTFRIDQYNRCAQSPGPYRHVW